MGWLDLDMKEDKLLEIKSLSVYYFTRARVIKAVEGVDLVLHETEVMGLAGESGCGKSTLGTSIIRVIPHPGRIVGGKILLEGKDIVSMSEKQLRKIRGDKISLVFQGAMNVLNPMFRVGDQIVEAIKVHNPSISNDEAVERVMELFEMIQIPPDRMTDYPHEFSGGMKQRALIVMALSSNPKVLILDEPTTALDVIIQAEVLDLLEKLTSSLHLSSIVVTHDLSVISQLCRSIAVMYAGKIVEIGNMETVKLKDSIHPYTEQLMSCFPDIYKQTKKIKSIPGYMPDPSHMPTGCRFHPRCSSAMDICKREEPKLVQISKKHFVACHLYPK